MDEPTTDTSDAEDRAWLQRNESLLLEMQRHPDNPEVQRVRQMLERQVAVVRRKLGLLS
jgi:hypothetical protein